MLNSFFTPSWLDDVDFDKNQIGNIVRQFHESEHRQKELNIAFIFANNSTFQGFRKEMYTMKNHFPSLNIYDMGQLNKVSYDEFQSLHQTFIDKNIFPIYLGLNSIFISSLLKSDNGNGAYQDCCIYAPDLDLYEELINLELDKQTRFSPVAYQGHLCSLDSLSKLSPEFRSTTRLGVSKGKQYVGRTGYQAGQISFSSILFVLKSNEIPGSSEHSPTGLTLEECCQLIKYIGHSEHATNLFIKEAEQLYSETGFKVLANLIWYFLLGFVNKESEELSEDNPNLISYLVPIRSSDETLKFIKSNKTGKWWVQHVDQPGTYIACTYEDYLNSCNNDIPLRIMSNCF